MRAIRLIACWTLLLGPVAVAAQARVPEEDPGYSWPRLESGATLRVLAPTHERTGSLWRTGYPAQAGPGDNEPSVVGAMVGGALGGALGLGVGVLVLSGCDLEGSDCLGPLILLAALEPVGMALGAHVGDRRRGSLGLDILVSFLTGGIGLVLDELGTTRGIGEGNEYLFAGAAQLGAVVITEVITGRRP